jgi:hypothetical protein
MIGELELVESVLVNLIELSKYELEQRRREMINNGAKKRSLRGSIFGQFCLFYRSYFKMFSGCTR